MEMPSPLSASLVKKPTMRFRKNLSASLLRPCRAVCEKGQSSFPSRYLADLNDVPSVRPTAIPQARVGYIGPECTFPFPGGLGKISKTGYHKSGGTSGAPSSLAGQRMY